MKNIFLLLLVILILMGCQKTQEQINVNDLEVSKPYQFIDTTNWQMYRNEEYGFEVKYPEDWTMQQKEYRHWQSFDFNKSECVAEYEDYGCDDEFLFIDVSNESVDELRTSSLWSWAVSDGSSCDHSIPLLNFNIDYNISTCENDSLGFKWQGYFFEKDSLRYLFTIRYNEEGYNSPIGKKILETFTFIEN